MSMDLGGAKGGVKSDINVTPLVDVMLVLLIIMMLVAPLLQQGVNVKLPEAENTVDKPEVSDQTVDRDRLQQGDLFERQADFGRRARHQGHRDPRAANRKNRPHQSR